MSFLMDSDMLGRKNEEEEENDRSSIFGWEGSRDLGVQNVIIPSESFFDTFYLCSFNIVG